MSVQVVLVRFWGVIYGAVEVLWFGCLRSFGGLFVHKDDEVWTVQV
jgi:hypothetical protein